MQPYFKEGMNEKFEMIHSQYWCIRVILEESPMLQTHCGNVVFNLICGYFQSHFTPVFAGYIVHCFVNQLSFVRKTQQTNKI